MRIIERTRLGAHPGAIFFSIFLSMPPVSIGSRQPDGCSLQHHSMLHLNPKCGAQTAPRKGFAIAFLCMGATMGTKIRAVRFHQEKFSGNLLIALAAPIALIVIVLDGRKSPQVTA